MLSGWRRMEVRAVELPRPVLYLSPTHVSNEPPDSIPKDLRNSTSTTTAPDRPKRNPRARGRRNLKWLP
jgi:hypothetical protein